MRHHDCWYLTLCCLRRRLFVLGTLLFKEARRQGGKEARRQETYSDTTSTSTCISKQIDILRHHKHMHDTDTPWRRKLQIKAIRLEWYLTALTSVVKVWWSMWLDDSYPLSVCRDECGRRRLISTVLTTHVCLSSRVWSSFGAQCSMLNAQCSMDEVSLD